MPECFKDDNASQWKSGKSDTRSLKKKPLTDRHLNLHGRLSRGSLPLCKMSSRYDYPISPPQCENAPQVTRLVFFCFSFSLQPRPLHRISRSIRQMKSFRARMSFWGSRKQNFTFRPYFPPNANFWSIFAGTSTISRQKALTLGMLKSKLPLIVIVAPWKLLQQGLVYPKFRVECVAPPTILLRLTDGQTDRQTAFSSLDRICITCSAVKT